MTNRKLYHSLAALIGLLSMLCVLALNGCKSKAHVDQPPAIAGDPPIEWRLTTMQGVAVTAERPVTLRLGKDGSMSGQSFVNNMFGPAKIGGDREISVGPAGMTMMAGPDDLMDLEQRYIKLLGRVNRYKASGDTLALLHDDEVLLEFVRHAS